MYSGCGNFSLEMRAGPVSLVTREFDRNTRCVKEDATQLAGMMHLGQGSMLLSFMSVSFVSRQTIWRNFEGAFLVTRSEWF